MPAAFVDTMRIRISAIDTLITRDQRAYAEYRFFISTAPYGPHVTAVDVMVRRDIVASGQVRCTVAVDLGQCGRVKTQARATHPGAAIDRAADRAAWLIGRRVGRDYSAKAAAFTS